MVGSLTDNPTVANEDCYPALGEEQIRSNVAVMASSHRFANLGPD